jgi:hypothetical protein
MADSLPLTVSVYKNNEDNQQEYQLTANDLYQMEKTRINLNQPLT